MALPSEDVQLLATAYWRILNREGDPAVAQRIFRQRNRNASPQQLTAAIGQVQRGLETSARIEQLPAGSRLRDALEGARPPASRVGVRVDVEREFPDGSTRTNTIFVDARWDWTIDQLEEAIEDWATGTESHGYNVVRHDFTISGFTRFPLSYQH